MPSLEVIQQTQPLELEITPASNGVIVDALIKGPQSANPLAYCDAAREVTVHESVSSLMRRILSYFAEEDVAYVSHDKRGQLSPPDTRTIKVRKLTHGYLVSINDDMFRAIETMSGLIGCIDTLLHNVTTNTKITSPE